MPILSYLFLFARKRCLFKRMLFLYCCRNHSIDDVKQSHPWRKLHFSLFRQSSTMKSLQRKGQTNPGRNDLTPNHFCRGRRKSKSYVRFPCGVFSLNRRCDIWSEGDLEILFWKSRKSGDFHEVHLAGVPLTPWVHTDLRGKGAVSTTIDLQRRLNDHLSS